MVPRVSNRLTMIVACTLMAVGICPAGGLPIIDGTIGSGEYDSTMSFGRGRFNLHWSIIGDEVYFGLQGQTSGWVALGLEPTQTMKDADMLLGWVSAGSASVLDGFSEDVLGPHPPDVNFGGTSDILEFDGSESGGRTTIELKRKLHSGDRYDKDVKTEGPMSIIWAVGSSDNYLAKHVEAGSGVINMEMDRVLLLGTLVASVGSMAKARGSSIRGRKAR